MQTLVQGLVQIPSDRRAAAVKLLNSSSPMGCNSLFLQVLGIM
jgi:hypothetical protein